jgi:hypothetical protein
VLAACLAAQYVHGIFTQLAHRMHRPAAQPLPDLGFELTRVRGSSAVAAALSVSVRAGTHGRTPASSTAALPAPN